MLKDVYPFENVLRGTFSGETCPGAAESLVGIMYWYGVQVHDTIPQTTVH